MPRPKISIPGTLKLTTVQTLTGVAANATADFSVSARGAQPEFFYVVGSRQLGSAFTINQSWCSAANFVNVRICNETGTSAAIGSCQLDIIGL
jgi:hypothetical protein